MGRDGVRDKGERVEEQEEEEEEDEEGSNDY